MEECSIHGDMLCPKQHLYQVKESILRFDIFEGSQGGEIQGFKEMKNVDGDKVPVENNRSLLVSQPFASIFIGRG